LLLILDECLKKKTVEENVLSQIPEFSWNELRISMCLSSSECEAETCRICLFEYADSDVICTLPCKHFYHKGCIIPWLSSNSCSCPLDGQEVSVF